MIVDCLQKKKYGSLEMWCAILFFLCLVLNDCFGEKPGYHLIPKYLILVFMVSVFFLIWVKKTRFPIALITILAFNLIWWLLSCVWTAGNAGFIYTVSLNLLLGLMVFLFFYQSEQYDVLFYALFVSGVALMIFSLFVYGLDGFLDVLQEEERLGGEITNENTFGKVFAYALVSGLYLTICKKKYWSLLCCVLFLALSLASGSRKAILIVIIGVTLLLFLRVGLKKPLAFTIILVTMLAVLWLVLQLPIFSVANERFTSLVLGGDFDYSTDTRNQMISEGLNLFTQKPLLGWGISGYAAVSGFGTYSHNNFVEMLVNYGIVGFVLYYSIYAYIIISLLIKIKLRSASPQHAMILTLIVTALVMDYGNVSYDMKWMWMIMGVGLAFSANIGKTTIKHQSAIDEEMTNR